MPPSRIRINPDSGVQHYINPTPGSAEDLEAAYDKLRAMAGWLRDMAAQTEARLGADKPKAK